MNANNLIEKMRLRQRELLNRFLPASAVKEFYQISEAIDSISIFMLHEEMENRRSKEKTKQPTKRTPRRTVSKMSVRERMVNFLRQNGPSSPKQIRTGLRLRKDSNVVSNNLSVYANRYFTRVSEGMWTLMEPANPTAQSSGSRQPIPTGIAAKRVPMNNGATKNGK